MRGYEKVSRQYILREPKISSELSPCIIFLLGLPSIAMLNIRPIAKPINISDATMKEDLVKLGIIIPSKIIIPPESIKALVPLISLSRSTSWFNFIPELLR